MMRQVIRSKIHNATVTDANLAYIGSITIDKDLIEKADLWPGEKVLVVSNTSGARLETYVIKGSRGSGTICMNGPAARKTQVGDVIIIISYAQLDFEKAKTFKPYLAFPDKNNKLILD